MKKKPTRVLAVEMPMPPSLDELKNLRSDNAPIVDGIEEAIRLKGMDLSSKREIVINLEQSHELWEKFFSYISRYQLTAEAGAIHIIRDWLYKEKRKASRGVKHPLSCKVCHSQTNWVRKKGIRRAYTDVLILCGKCGNKQVLGNLGHLSKEAKDRVFGGPVVRDKKVPKLSPSNYVRAANIKAGRIKPGLSMAEKRSERMRLRAIEIKEKERVLKESMKL